MIDHDEQAMAWFSSPDLHRQLFCLVRRRSRIPERCKEDVVQEALLHIWERRFSLWSPIPWRMLGWIVDKVISRQVGPDVLVSSTPTASARSPAEHMIQTRQEAALLLEQCSAPQREILLLRAIGLDDAQIGRRLSITRQAVNLRRNQAIDEHNPGGRMSRRRQMALKRGGGSKMTQGTGPGRVVPSPPTRPF